ncbi:hypothetical protein Rsub_09325 [Raphidocelis subcapitata]|uniref:Alcohol dehydrogenase iron-type/glycerol dehydrogenase GldA domain-containing protein n=1 Tax=Raphidocelis subcapitata TaxID=307507 RepID=A0A2V0PCL8_9CHLO|nr:hypothetical protein Rsub_09325 [Raphidocelis subcapitata]|eukprot:GBF96692.1 hypothetical protein Rsub_09325 [Raphidocelis subcapitata]
MPPVSIYCSPERYVQGAGATAALGEQMALLKMRGPVLIVAERGREFVPRDEWAATLGPAGYEFFFHGFNGECSQQEIDAIAAQIKARACGAVVGSGGGKTIDAARAAAYLAGAEFVSMPTAASCDAPCSALSVVYTESGAFSKYMRYPRHPTLVVVDTAVVARGPKRLLVAGLGDALATWYEARTVAEARADNFFGGKPTVTGTGLALLCRDILVADGAEAAAAMDTHSVTPALERVVEANTLLSGLGFESGGLCVAHACHNGLTCLEATHRYLHGEKVAFGLCTQMVLEGRPREETDTVLTFCEKVGLPTTLAEVGVDSGDADAVMQVAERTCQKGETSHNEPFEVTARMVADAIAAADRLGTLHRDKAWP